MLSVISLNSAGFYVNILLVSDGVYAGCLLVSVKVNLDSGLVLTGMLSVHEH